MQHSIYFRTKKVNFTCAREQKRVQMILIHFAFTNCYLLPRNLLLSNNKIIGTFSDAQAELYCVSSESKSILHYYIFWQMIPYHHSN
jgi:hypothetical protein